MIAPASGLPDGFVEISNLPPATMLTALREHG